MFAACESRVRRRPGTPVSSPTPQPPSPPSPLSPKANTSASAACWGKSLPAEPDRSPAALPPPRQHPSLTRSLPLLALPLTLTPSAGAETLPEWAAGAGQAGEGEGGHARSGSPEQQSYGWEAGLLGIQGSKISGHSDNLPPPPPLPPTHHPPPPPRSQEALGRRKSGSPREGGTHSESQRAEVGVLHSMTPERVRSRGQGSLGI